MTRADVPLPERVTLPLLELIGREALDADYEVAARARRRPDRPRDPTARRRAMVSVATITAVFGLMIALAAVQNSRESDVQEAGRVALVDRIDQRRTVVTGLRERAAGLRDEIDGLGSLSVRLTGSVASTAGQVRRLELGSGLLTVRGPGVRITVGDNPDGSADGLVRAADLSLLVNALWQADAEAVAVNGRRLAALSAIVNSDIAIQVNRQPLSPPYVVTAIGDAVRLQAAWPTTATGQQFLAVAQTFGYSLERHNEAELELPAGPDGQLRLRFAREDDALPDKQPAEETK